jgi:hypothetical protein
MVISDQADPHQRYTPEAIDEIVARGGQYAALIELRDAALHDQRILGAVEQVCAPYVRGSDLFEPHHWFWVAWIEKPLRTPPPCSQ